MGRGVLSSKQSKEPEKAHFSPGKLQSNHAVLSLKGLCSKHNSIRSFADAQDDMAGVARSVILSHKAKDLFIRETILFFTWHKMKLPFLGRGSGGPLLYYIASKRLNEKRCNEILRWRFAIAPLAQNDSAPACHPERSEGSPP